jgi:hypothetical protein
MIAFLASCILLLISPSLEKARLFFFDSETEKKNEQFFEATKHATLETDAVVYAYNALSMMRKAEHTINPYSKYKHFNQGKEKLEQAIKHAPTNSEIRFIRLSAQAKTPSFLGYSNNQQEDLRLVKSAIVSKKFSTDNGFAKNVIKFMASIKVISNEEQSTLLKLYN